MRQPRDPPWLWNPGQTSPEVQNRGINNSKKRTYVLLQFFFLKKGRRNQNNLENEYGKTIPCYIKKIGYYFTVGCWYLCIWTLGDICSGIQSQGGFLTVISCLCTMILRLTSWAWYLTTSWWLTWQLSPFSHIIFNQRQKAITGTLLSKFSSFTDGATREPA